MFHSFVTKYGDRLGKDYDVAILLHDICVVDLDSTDLVEEMEERFPILKSCPCEETRKGVH